MWFFYKYVRNFTLDEEEKETRTCMKNTK